MNYAFDHQWKQERARLTRLEAGMDPGSTRLLTTLGVKPGGHCLEIGGGGGSIASWLCQRVGPEGHVVATDLQTHFLEALDIPNLDVRRHDISADPLEEEAFDYVHCRAVIEHLPDPDSAVNKMVAALKPGGWLLLESHDFATLLPVCENGSDLFRKASDAFLKLLQQQGFNPALGRRCRAMLSEQGLVDCKLEGRVYEIGGDRQLTPVWSLVVQRLRGPLVDSGLLSTGEVDEALDVIDSPGFAALGPCIIAAWGQKPL